LPTDVTKSVDRQVRSFINNVAAVTAGGPAFVDPYGPNPGERMTNGQLTALAVLSEIAQLGHCITPMYGLQRDVDVWTGLPPTIAKLGQGFAFRVDGDDLDDQAEETWAEVLERTTQLGLKPGDVDLLIDLRSIRDRDIGRLERSVLDFLALRPASFVPRSMTIAGSSAARDVTAVPRNGDLALPRDELRLWARIAKTVGPSISLQFGDYGVIHPEFQPAGPAPHANAKIRYATAGSIHYFRGCSLRHEGARTQYPALARRVLSSPSFQGAAFSAGDRFIAGCCADHPGNLGTWVRVDQNHHFELSAKQLAILAPAIRTARSVSAAEGLITA